MNEIWLKVLNWLIPAICSGVVSGVAVWFKMRKKKDSAVADGVQCLLRAEIIRNHDKYVERAFCPIYAKEALRRAYKAYHTLGGNDVATALYNEVLALPTDEPARKEEHA
jgi:hypothetical protein